MEPQSSNRSSNSSLNVSLEGIVMQVPLRNSDQYRTSQSLTSVINTPDGTVFEYIYDYIYKSFAFGVEPSPILQDINYEDFLQYLNKITPYLKDNPKQDKKDCTNEYTIQRCYAEIPNIFFQEDFRVESILEESVLSQQEMISMYLDIADVSIFNKISQKWEEIMNTAFGLETMKEEISILLSNVSKVSKDTRSLQVNLVEKYMKIIRFNRRLANIQKVQEKLKLIETIKDVQPALNDLINQGHYTSVTQLLLKTQQTLNSKLQGISSLKEYSYSLEKTRANLSSQLDQEFSVSAHQFIVLNTFVHTEKLVKALKNNISLDSAFKLFPKESNYERMNELIQNKINTSSLHQSLQEMHKSLRKEITENLKKLFLLLGVHKTDENSKWVNISHPHFMIVLQSLFAIFNSIFQKFQTLASLILRQFTSDSGSYSDMKKTIQFSGSKIIISELDDIESTLSSMFFEKIKKVITSRESFLINGGTVDLKELYELCEKISLVSRHLSLTQTNPILPLVLKVQKEYLHCFHDRKQGELSGILEAETWMKIEVPEEMLKFIMDRRGEASRIAGIKLESPEIIATSSILIFYKIIYEYVKISEELQISLECGSRIIEIMKFYNLRTYELIVEAKAVPHRLARVTSKHLALSVQGLTFILQEFPYIENRLSSRTKDFATVLLTEFCSTKADYTSHLKAIYDKLCFIIIFRVNEHCDNAVTEAKWDTMISPSQIDKDYYVKQIITDIVSMHSILLSVLKSEQIFEVFSTILQALANSLLGLYEKVQINTYVPAQRVKNDTQQLLLALREKLSAVLLEPLEDLDDKLQKFVSDRCEGHLKM